MVKPSACWPMTVEACRLACGATWVAEREGVGQVQGENNVGGHGRTAWALVEQIWGVATTLAELRAGDAFAALPFVDCDGHAYVREALERGACFALVDKAWFDAAPLPPALLERCAWVENVLTAYRGLIGTLRPFLTAPVVAVIGAAGKTTTKELLALMLETSGKRVVKTPGTDNGWVGLPRTLARCLTGPPGEVDVAVIEIGIDAVGAMASHAALVRPDWVVLTSLGAEHLAGLESEETAVNEELSLLVQCPDARRILPMEDPHLMGKTALLRPGDVAVVKKGPVAENLKRRGDVGVLEVQETRLGTNTQLALRYTPCPGEGPPMSFGLTTRLLGSHQARNVALAAASALVLGGSLEDISRAAAAFEPPTHRMNCHLLERDIVLLDDCFNAVPGAMIAALETLAWEGWEDRPKVVVLGDMLDLGAHSERYHREVGEILNRLVSVHIGLFGPQMCRVVGPRLDRETVGEVHLLERGDPLELVLNKVIPDRAVILVKGSHGMNLSPVGAFLRMRYGTDRDAELTRFRADCFWIGVTGTYRARVALLLARALREGSADERVEVSASWQTKGAPSTVEADLLRFYAAVARGVEIVIWELSGEAVLFLSDKIDFDLVIFTGLALGDKAEAAELELATVAQLFVRGKPPGAAVLIEGDECSAMLAEVIGPKTKVVMGDMSCAPGEKMEDVLVQAAFRAAFGVLDAARKMSLSK